MTIIYSNELLHYGVPHDQAPPGGRGSGRYPWGSGGADTNNKRKKQKAEAKYMDNFNKAYQFERNRTSPYEVNNYLSSLSDDDLVELAKRLDIERKVTSGSIDKAKQSNQQKSIDFDKTVNTVGNVIRVTTAAVTLGTMLYQLTKGNKNKKKSDS